MSSKSYRRNDSIQLKHNDYSYVDAKKIKYMKQYTNQITVLSHDVYSNYMKFYENTMTDVL